MPTHAGGDANVGSVVVDTPEQRFEQQVLVSEDASPQDILTEDGQPILQEAGS